MLFRLDQPAIEAAFMADDDQTRFASVAALPI